MRNFSRGKHCPSVFFQWMDNGFESNKFIEKAEKMDFEQAVQYVLDRMQKELSPQLLYHSIGHTRDDVVPAVGRLAEFTGVKGESLTLLQTAAWFHDLGFVISAVDHELKSVQIAKDVLPGYGYSSDQIKIVEGAILATIVPQNPQSELGLLLSDADLDVLGRQDFFDRNMALRKELENFGRKFSDEEWYINQIKFIEAHRYFSSAARMLRDEQKQNNLAALRRLLTAIKK